MRSVFVAAALVAAVASNAHAGKKVKAELLCGIFVDGNVTDMVPSAGKPRLDKPVACALHLSDVGDDTYMANIHTVRSTVDAASGKKTKVTTSGHTSDVGGTNDLEFVMTPGANDENGEVDFQPCEDFDVVASVFDDRGKYFAKTIHVAQACPKPKALKAKVGCYANKDGDRIDLPDKAKKSLDGYTVTCFGMSTDPRFNGTGVKFSAQTEYFAPNMNDTDGHTKNDARYGTYEEGEDESAFTVDLPTDDVPACLGSFDVHIAIDDPSGMHLFAKTITVKQVCN